MTPHWGASVLYALMAALLMAWPGARGYPTESGACSGPRPNPHGYVSAAPSPFKLSASSLAGVAGSTITVTLVGALFWGMSRKSVWDGPGGFNERD